MIRFSRVVATPVEKVTEAEFKSFVELQRSGAVNMASLEDVCDLTDLSPESAKSIIQNYETMMKSFPKVTQ